MVTRLHVLTACSRPDNLAALAGSLAAAATLNWELCWHLRFDLDRKHVGGQQLKNDMLDQISDGWVYVLDDDTIVHPDLFQAAAQLTGRDAVVVSQDRTDGRLLNASAENVRVGHIDIGQAVIRRNVIGQHRIPIHYEGDGWFLMDVLAGRNVAYVETVLSHHNLLERVTA